MSRRATPKEYACSFCGITAKEGEIVHGPDVCVCEPCVALLAEIVESRYFYGPPGPPLGYRAPDPPPEPVAKPAKGPVNWAQPGYVYFLHAHISNRIKIGFSINPDRRIESLLTGCPERLTFLGSIRAAYRDETELHQRFAAIRVHREWFTATPELLAHIKEVLAQ